jgi:hypothetical protein
MRPPVARRSQVRCRVGPASRPAMTGFGAGLGGMALAVHGQDHRMPAPTVSAMAASVATAQVKRARFAFTIDSF